MAKKKSRKDKMVRVKYRTGNVKARNKIRKKERHEKRIAKFNKRREIIHLRNQEISNHWFELTRLRKNICWIKKAILCEFKLSLSEYYNTKIKNGV